ncbi:MAG: hypothetical protein ACYSWQ_14790 [Planctomycetota bacterium]|jgi:hypothetical protein
MNTDSLRHRGREQGKKVKVKGKIATEVTEDTEKAKRALIN